MNTNIGKPYKETALAQYINRRVIELRPKKSQLDISAQAGFLHANMVSLIKSGATKLPLDRVAGMAAALECDPAYLLRLTLQQHGMAGPVYDEILTRVITRNEMSWVIELRAASSDSDPHLTNKGRAALKGVFGK